MRRTLAGMVVTMAVPTRGETSRVTRNARLCRSLCRRVRRRSGWTRRELAAGAWDRAGGGEGRAWCGGEGRSQDEGPGGRGGQGDERERVCVLR